MRKQAKYREVVYDFFGQMNDAEQRSANKIILYLQKSRGIRLSEEERDIVLYARSNMESIV